ncbi:transcriptional repressor [Thiospirochaeta perfilievii]|uniref:Transcriptional repressor n=1 Tax=Thiospirochaeta perfilievii TaxID=252967 RepID=A0A5C1QGH5_9SPIO|nr:transcriptional repressor [Thiospirochaeta perfilievii]QEN06179.1 transcriptional repressor [Thiospirochaeta perfilievii]
MVRMTNQRKVILDELMKHVDHPTADEIYVEIRKVLPKVSLGTVYRNLDQMSQQGKILKLEGAGQKRFDPVATPHPHFRCVQCGCVEDIHERVTSPVIDENSQWYKDRSFLGFNLEYYGKCSKCK